MTSAPSPDQFCSVLTGAWDDLPVVLSHLGLPFRELGKSLLALDDPHALDGSRALYLACGADYDLTERGIENIRAFVAGGGGLYASDLAAAAIEQIFPGMAQFGMTEYQNDNPVRVTEPGLAQLVGPQLSLHMDFTSAQGIEPVSPDVHTLICGRRQPNDPIEHAYLVVFAHGQGEVLYTVFHHSHQIEASEEKLLEYLVLRPLLIQARQQAEQTLAGQRVEGVSEIISAVRPDEITRRFEVVLPARCRMAAVLSWDTRSRSALGVQIYNPSGRLERYISSDQSPLVLHVPVREEGRWSVSVKGITSNESHVPFVLALGRR